MPNFEKAQKTAQRAFAFMEKHGVEPSAQNLAAWYVYAEGGDPDWNGRLDQLLAVRSEFPTGKLDDEVCQYLLGSLGCKRIFEGVNGLFSTVSHVTAAVSKAEADVQEYGRALGEGRDRLAGQEAPPSLRETIDDLILRTDDMVRKQEELVHDLDTSAHQIGLLRSRLEEARHRAITDPVTELVNEKYFFARLREIVEDAVQTGKNFSMAIVQIDRFEEFEGQHGPELAAKVLKLLAGIVANSTRETDIAGRIGPDEFGLIFPRTHQGETEHLVDRIRQTLGSRTLVKRGSSVALGRLTVSGGVTSHAGKETVEALVERTRAAVAHARNLGGNKVVAVP